MKSKKRNAHIILLIITLTFSLGFRIEHRYFYRNFYLDTEVQIAAAQNWLNGDGFVTHEVDSTDWSQTTTHSTQIFMPGYAFALAGLKLLFNDWLRANFVLDIIGLILVYLAVHLLFWKLTGSHFSKPYFLYLLWQAFSPAPMHYLTGSGLWALGIFLCGIAAIYLDSDKARKNILSYVGILLIVCTAWIRDAYMLFGLIPVIWFALHYGRIRNKTNLPPLIFSIFLFGLSQILIHGWWHAEASYLPRQAYGFFPGQLLFMDPFPFKSFFYYGIFHEQNLKLWSESAWVGLKIMSGIISITIIWIILKNGWEVIRRKPDDHSHARSFIFLAFITGLVNVGFIAASSLFIPADDWNWIGFWTFVMETRYFLPVMMVMLIWVFYVVFEEGMRKLHFSHTFLKLLVISSFFGAFTYPVWLKYKVHIRHETVGTFQEQKKRAVLQRMTQIVSDSDLPVRYTCSEETRLWDLSGAAKVDFLPVTQSDNFPLKSPVKLILVLEEDDSIPKLPLFFIEGQEEFGGKKLLYGILKENIIYDVIE